MGDSSKRILVIGAGGMGRRHLRAFQEAGADALACHDVSSDVLHATCAQFPGVEAIVDLAPSDLQRFDGCVIVTPTHTHLGYMERCLDAGVAFLVEKPIHIDTDGVQDVIDRASASGLVTGVAFPRRHAPGIREIVRRVRNGDIGTPKTLRTEFSQDFRKYRPDYREIYYAKLSSGGGILMDALSHHIDLAVLLGGPIQEVTSLQGQLVFDGVEGEDTAHLLLRFEDGMLGSVAGNQFQRPNVDTIELAGTEGNLRYDRITGVLAYANSDRPEWQTSQVDGDWDTVVRNQAGAFLQSLAAGRPVEDLTTLAEGLHGLRVVLAARRSAQDKRTVTPGDTA